MDLTTIDGLPMHPLIVHAVVILLPLSALAAVLIAARPAWRRRYGWPVLALTIAAVIAVPVAQTTGEQLQAALNVANPLIQRHADLGSQLLPYALAFGLLMIVFLVAGRQADREGAPKSWRTVTVAAAVLVALAGVASTVQVVRIGHSGATAVWNGVGTSR